MTQDLSILDRLISWARDNVNGDWEHGHGVKITTLDNPGWAVDIELPPQVLKKFDRHHINRSENDWLECWVDNNRFHARGGINNLGEAIVVFLRWIGR